MSSTARTTPQKISILVSDLSTRGEGRWGGSRVFLLCEALQRLSIDVEIVGFVFGDNPPSDVTDNFPVITISGTNYPQFLHSAREFLQQIHGDILYALRPKPTTFGLALWKKFRTGCPVILDIDDWELSWHGGEDFQYHPNPRQLARDLLKPNGALRYPDHPLYLKWMEGWSSRADAITVHTKFLQDRFGGGFVPNGKDTDLFDPSRTDPETCRARYGLSDYRVLMFPGAPRPYKGVEDVLMALDILEIPDLRLAIVGGSPYDDYDRDLIQQWGRWIVRFPPHPIEKMPELIAASHVVVVPQRDTPTTRAQFPLKLTDGMAMAKPVLATRVGDMPEVLGETGFLVAPSSPEDIAKAIAWIFENYELAQERGQIARRRCIKYYSLEAMSDILSTIIRNAT
ncbi:glycosyltransferase family 4 protein [Baaleninema sp.]|uniref:glycosyltransferase family 4 protein n=1 Tax=Baaleninema sp. TaxID=3101197 RepID=UPI003CFF990D